MARWVAAYERAWRAAGTETLAGIFTADASYRQGPYDEPVTGLPAIARMWDAERDGPGEVFEMTSEIVAADDDRPWCGPQVRYGRSRHPGMARSVDYPLRRRRPLRQLRGMAVRAERRPLAPAPPIDAGAR